MSLSLSLPPAEPDPGLLALFESSDRIPAAVRRQAEFFVFFAGTIFPRLESYRNRLLESGQESLAFVAVLDYLVQQGWVPKRSRQRLDSTHVWGGLSQMSRLECARETLRLFLEDVEAQGRLPAHWSEYWERYVEGKLDPRADKIALQAKSWEAGQDLLAIWRETADISSAPPAIFDGYSAGFSGSAPRSSRPRPRR